MQVTEKKSRPPAPRTSQDVATDLNTMLQHGIDNGEMRAEQVLMRLARGETVPENEIATALSMVPWGSSASTLDPRERAGKQAERNRRTQRAAEIVRVQQQIGDHATYQQGMAAVTQAEKEVAALRDKLARQTESVQQEIAAAEHKVKGLRSDIAPMHDARLALRSYARRAPHLQSQTQQARSLIQASLRRRDEIDAKIRHIDRLLALDADLQAYSREDGTGDFERANAAYKAIYAFADDAPEDHPLYTVRSGRLQVGVTDATVRPGQSDLASHPNERLLQKWREWIPTVKRERENLVREIEAIDNDPKLRDARAFVDRVEDYYLPV
jgi:hypothetical protein